MVMATPEEQLSQILALLSENSKGINEVKSSMSEMRTLRTEILTWKSNVDHRVHELEHVALDLGERIDQALGALHPPAQLTTQSEGELPNAVVTSPTPLTEAIWEDHIASPSVKVLSSTHLELLPPWAASGSLDHGKLSTHRGPSFRAVYTAAPNPTPVTGATHPPKTISVTINTDGSVHCDRIVYSPVHPPIPNLEFPTFDGSNPRLWIKYCETFFDVYGTDPSVWVRCATMPLVPNHAGCY
jgi:hypothetical protein